MNINKTLVVIGLLSAGLSLGVPLEARSASQKIEIENTWARLSRDEPGAASVYFDIVNRGEESDVLVSASSPVAEKAQLGKARLHGTEYKTHPIDHINVKPGLTTLGPGKMEIALSKLVKDVPLGHAIPVTLVFERAGRMEIEAVVGNQMLGNRLKR